MNSCIPITKIVNDCTTYCVSTYEGEPLSSILQKICTKAESFVETDPIFTAWLASFGLDEEGKILMSDGTTYTWVDPVTFTVDITRSEDLNNCLVLGSDGLLYVACPTDPIFYSVSNGLTENPSGNFILGGSLDQETTITQFAFGLNLIYDGTNAALHAYNSAAGTGLWGESTDGFGVYGSAITGVGVTGASTTGRAGVFQNNSSDTTPALYVTNEGGGTVAEFGTAQDGTSPTAQFLGSGQVVLPKYGIGTFADTEAYILAVNASGEVIEVNPFSGGIFTFRNALTESPAGTIEWGGTLLHTTTVDQRNGDYQIEFLGDAGNTQQFSVHGGAQAIYGQGTSIGITGQGPNVALWSINDTASTSAVGVGIALNRSTTGGVGANGVGSSLSWNLPNSAASTLNAGLVLMKFSDVTAGSEDSTFEVHLKEAGAASAARLAVLSTGQIRGHKYGTGLFTGTPTYNLATDASGNIIEVSPGGSQRFGVAGEDDTAAQNRSFNSSNFTTQLTYNTLTGLNAFLLSSSSTVAAGAQRLLDVTMSGASAASSVISTGLYSNISRTGTASKNIAAQFAATGAATNQALIIPAASGNVGIGTSSPISNNKLQVDATGSDTAIAANTASGYGVLGSVTTGVGIAAGIYGQGTGNAMGGIFQFYGVDSNTIHPVMRLIRDGTGGAGGNGMGGSTDMYLQPTTGVSLRSNQFIWKWIDATTATATSQLDISGLNSGTTNTIMSAHASGVVGIGIDTGFTGTRLQVVDNTLGALSMVKLTSTSTAAASNLQKMLEISLSGVNATASQSTYGIYLNNNHTGTGAISYGIYSSGTTYGIFGDSISAIGVYGRSSSDIGIAAQSTTGIGLNTVSDSGIALSATTNTGTYSGQFISIPATTNVTVPVLQILRDTSGTGANGIGASIDYYVATDVSAQLSNQLSSVWTNATDATRSSEFSIAGVDNAVTNKYAVFGSRNVLLGDLDAIGNGWIFAIQDSANIFSVASTAGSTFSLSDSTGTSVLSILGNRFIDIANSPKTVTIGDANVSTPYGNGTYIQVDDANQIITITNLQNFANDAGAAGGGIPVDGLYRNGSVVQIRVV